MYAALVIRLLFGFAVCSAAAATLTVLSLAEPSARWAELSRLTELAWPGSSPWRWALGTGLGAMGMAAAALALEQRLAASGQRLSLAAGKYESGKVSELVAQVKKRVSQALGGDSPNVVAAFDEIMRGAVSTEASDVHFSPTPEGLRITYRIMGELYEAAEVQLAWCQPFATRIKVLARLETHISKRSQDGRLVMTLDGGTLEARVSTLPTESGERVVLRIVRGSRTVPALSSLGFDPGTTRGLVEVLTRPQGLLFVTGPVGSGKTTTLYAALKHVVDSRGRTTSVVTLEDPIELELPFATQTQIHVRSGRTFASTLRSVLRQDPNVLMVGEIRDQETAEIAVQAGLTGHLILTTIHADGAAGPFARLMDMNVEPFAVASATLGCLSQRLLRGLCTACRREEQPEAIVRERFERSGVPLPVAPYYVPVGCQYCEGHGYAGRTPIAELLVMDGELRQAVTQRRTTTEILELARRQTFVPLLEDGLARARRGETSLAEVLRVAG